MTNIDALMEDLAVADRILAAEGADGDVDICQPDHPDRLPITASLARERVLCDDIGGLGSQTVRAGGAPGIGVAVQRGGRSARHQRVVRVDFPEPCR
jgi:hypothetical protein